MKQTSTVKWFDAKKGYGFIQDPSGGADIFVHYTAIESEHRFRTLHTDEPVEFELVDGPKGVHARNVVSCDPTFRPADEAPTERFEAPRAAAPAAAPSALPLVPAQPAQPGASVAQAIRLLPF